MIWTEMMERMPAPEFMQWHEVMRVDPFGGIRGDIQAALIAMQVVNMSGKVAKKDAELKDFLLEFMPKEKKEASGLRRQQTPEEMHANFLAVFKAATKKQKLKDAS